MDPYFSHDLIKDEELHLDDYMKTSFMRKKYLDIWWDILKSKDNWDVWNFLRVTLERPVVRSRYTEMSNDGIPALTFVIMF